MSERSDRLWLFDMRSACDEVLTFTDGATREMLDTDRMLYRALMMTVGIIGEAASQVSIELRTNHPEIPWRDIIGMRNFLFHAYFKIDKDILWQAATESVPALRPQLDVALEEMDST